MKNEKKSSLPGFFRFAYASICELFFSFSAVYYTISIMLTYSGNGVAAIDILSRSVEIIEVLCSYIFIGIIATNIIGKTSENI